MRRRRGFSAQPPGVSYKRPPVRSAPYAIAPLERIAPPRGFLHDHASHSAVPGRANANAVPPAVTGIAPRSGFLAHQTPAAITAVQVRARQRSARRNVSPLGRVFLHAGCPLVSKYLSMRGCDLKRRSWIDPVGRGSTSEPGSHPAATVPCFLGTTCFQCTCASGTPEARRLSFRSPTSFTASPRTASLVSDR